MLPSHNTADDVNHTIGNSAADADSYLIDADTSTCDLILVFESQPFPVHTSIMEGGSDFIKTWTRFPGLAPSSHSHIEGPESARSSHGDINDLTLNLNLDLPHIEVAISPVTIPFGNQYYPITVDDFRNYLRMVYSVWRPQAEPLLAMKIVPIADFMQSRHVLELCDLDAASTPIPWSVRLCHTAFDFARQWSLPHLAVAICAWIDAHVAQDSVLARLLSSTTEHFLAMLPELNLDPIVQIQTLVRYVARRPLGYDLSGDELHVEGDMVDVLCRGYRGLFGNWTRTRAMLEVLRLTRGMTFSNTDAGYRVMQCLLEILQKQLQGGPLVYVSECHCGDSS